MILIVMLPKANREPSWCTPLSMVGIFFFFFFFLFMKIETYSMVFKPRLYVASLPECQPYREQVYTSLFLFFYTSLYGVHICMVGHGTVTIV